jgi:hypothetical protein
MGGDPIAHLSTDWWLVHSHATGKKRETLASFGMTISIFFQPVLNTGHEASVVAYGRQGSETGQAIAAMLGKR